MLSNIHLHLVAGLQYWLAHCEHPAHLSNYLLCYFYNSIRPCGPTVESATVKFNEELRTEHKNVATQISIQ